MSTDSVSKNNTINCRVYMYTDINYLKFIDFKYTTIRKKYGKIYEIVLLRSSYILCGVQY